MEKIPYDDILTIQKKANIVDIISEYLPLEQRGRNYFAICPFHDDHNPSLSISPEKQIYTCFVCGASGNVFNFVMNYEKISFVEAVQKVASKVGINLNIKTNTKKVSYNEKYDKYYKMFDVVNKFYQNNINTVYGKNAIEYLKKRRITEDVIKEFGIGLSLSDNSISKLLSKKGYTDSELEEIGICGLKDNFLYDIFRSRIMFPLNDTEGNVVGFSGRIYNGEDESKYVNSKESIIFKKGKMLYNYSRAFKEAREKKQIIVVEGFMDVIRLYTIGITNTVATMGTAITKEHADLIRKLSKNVILCFDGDKAGEKATISALQALEDIDLKPEIIRLEDDLDPDDYIIKKGKDAFINHLKNPISALDFKLDINAKDINDNNYAEISNYINKMVNELNKINDKVVLELTIKKLAKKTGVNEKTILDMLKNKPKEEKVIINKTKPSTRNKYEKAEEYLIYYMLKTPLAINKYQDNVSYLSNKILSKIAIKILEFYDKNGYINTTDFTLYLQDNEELISTVLKIDSYDMQQTINEEVIDDLIKTIDDGILKREIEKTKDKIKKEVDVTKKVALLNKLRELKKKEC